MPQPDLIRRILRSLCANSKEEEDAALENYGRTDINHLQLPPIPKRFSDLLRDSYSNYGGPPSTATIRDRAHRKSETDLSLYAEEIAAEAPEWGANYTSLIAQFCEDRDTARLADILTEAAQILRDGVETQEKGLVRGVPAAVEYLMHQTVDLQRTADPRRRSMATPEAIDHLHQEYITRRDKPALAYGLTMGLTPIDQATKGGQPGELWTLAGFVSHGKSTWALSWARFLAVECGFSVLYFTLEMSKEQVWRILAAGHSAHPKFGKSKPLEYEKIKSGTLSSEDGSFYLNEVLPDLRSPDYGWLEVESPVGHTTMSEIRSRAEVIHKSRPLDLVFIDYLSLVGSEQKRGSRNQSKGERINESFIMAKQMALEFDHGNGIVVGTAHQINRKGAEEAAKTQGVYVMNALADANECERSSDAIFTIYQDLPLRQKKECVITNLKNRDGRICEPFHAFLPPEYRFVAELLTTEGGLSMETILGV